MGDDTTQGTAQENEYAQYIGRRVRVQRRLPEPNAAGHSVEEIEGIVETANELGFVLKPKGRTQVDLIEASVIEGVELLPEPTKAIKPKKLQEVAYGGARQHLSDRHGVALEVLNATPYTERVGLDQHALIDHSQLGHTHEAEDKTENVDGSAGVEAGTAAVGEGDTGASAPGEEAAALVGA